MKNTFTYNNFDLIRLLAATQVLIVHALSHLGFRDSPILDWMYYFPGVPIFFFASGFLISRSYENSSSLTEYFSKRALRLYPALFLCVFLSTASVFFVGYFEGVTIPWGEFVGWVFTQASFLQFYNPEFMRGYGVGVLNGSLWTISVEVQFYIMTPFFYFLINSVFKKRKQIGWITLLLFFMGTSELTKFLDIQGVAGKLLGVSFIPWVYMFILGILFQLNFETLHLRLRGRGGLLFAIYLGVCFLGDKWLGFNFGNSISLIVFLLLAPCVFALSYSVPGLSDSILKRNDISYGVYIYHMPVFNAFIYLGLSNQNSLRNLALASFITFVIAALSWFILEKPFLKFKRNATYKH